MHVTDLADAHLRALDYLDHEKKDLIVNLGTSSGISVLEILKIAGEISATEISYETGPRRDGDPAVVLAKSDLAADVLEWSAKYSDVQTLLSSTFSAYKSNYKNY